MNSAAVRLLVRALASMIHSGNPVDLVGSYKPDMREADDDVLVRSRIFVDILEGATKESGDIVIPLNSGKISISDIAADLYGLCENKLEGRKSPAEITVFKSVGYALEDLVGGEYFYQKYLKQHSS